METFAERFSRRAFLVSGIAAAGLLAQEPAKGTAFPSAWRRYADPTTELEVFRLTDPAYSSTLPAYYSRSIAKNSGSLLYGCDRTGTPQAFRMDLKNGATKQLTEAENLDPDSLTLTPDNRSFCYFAGRSLFLVNLGTLRDRELYQIPDGWERCSGMTVGPDGTHATFAEKQGEGSRLRMVALVQGGARTVLEAPFVIADPLPRPMRAQVLYRQGDQALWLANADGKQAHQLKLAEGRVGPANWAPDGKTILYLSFPADRTQLNTIREQTPDANTDKLVAKTSQFAHFGFNKDTTVFVGASRNAASPTVLLMLRVTRRELTLCEHKASRVETTAPMFSPDSQRIYFQSDRDGKPAIYCMHVEKLVEKTDSETGY
ncbi:MAG TPA: oligogalacturonate lyase family protein [Bryobacteraceae bacterium]